MFKKKSELIKTVIEFIEDIKVKFAMDSDEENSMDLIDQMGLCNPESKPSMPPRRLTEAKLMAKTTEITDDISKSHESESPKPKRKKSSSPKRGRGRGLVRSGTVIGITPKRKEPPKSDKEKLDEMQQRKMEMLGSDIEL